MKYIANIFAVRSFAKRLENVYASTEPQNEKMICLITPYIHNDRISTSN